MSYDLLVFDCDAAPSDPFGFMDWYELLTKWKEGHDYSDPANTTDALQSWYRDMIDIFPPMNGPDATEADSDVLTGYTCARHAIYADFRWTIADQAQRTSFELAKRHGLGFWDVSDSLDVFGPVRGAYGILFRINLS